MYTRRPRTVMFRPTCLQPHYHKQQPKCVMDTSRCALSEGETKSLSARFFSHIYTPFVMSTASPSFSSCLDTASGVESSKRIMRHYFPYCFLSSLSLSLSVDFLHIRYSETLAFIWGRRAQNHFRHIHWHHGVVHLREQVKKGVGVWKCHLF